MKVDVLRILDPSQDVVFFSCESGSAPGRWMGGKPVGSGEFNVEIEIPEEVAEWTAASSGRTVISRVSESGSDVRIECEVVRFDDKADSVVEVRLGSDILLVEILSRRSELSVGALISFQVPEIQLYPYDI